jgi:hypothetical protein
MEGSTPLRPGGGGGALELEPETPSTPSPQLRSSSSTSVGGRLLLLGIEDHGPTQGPVRTPTGGSWVQHESLRRRRDESDYSPGQDKVVRPATHSFTAKSAWTPVKPERADVPACMPDCLHALLLFLCVRYAAGAGRCADGAGSRGYHRGPGEPCLRTCCNASRLCRSARQPLQWRADILCMMGSCGRLLALSER